MILVAGGTGRLGRLVVTQLAASGLQVRVLTRHPTAAADLGLLGVEVVRGDVRDPVSVAAAVRGVELVVSAVHGFAGSGHVSPASVDRDGNITLIDAARSVGAELVLISVVGASADSPMELSRMKHAAECHLDASAIPGTVVRATAFLELWLEILDRTARRSGRPVVLGRGENPLNLVSVTDVAALVERVVRDRRRTRGLTLEIGGPENFTMNQLAMALQSAADRHAPPRHVSPRALSLTAASIGRVHPALARQIRSALAMDRLDLGAPTGLALTLFPDLPRTFLATLLERAPTASSHATSP